jgi:hypothetical protein
MSKRSPFPGMDPWLERRWGDVHLRLCGAISAALQPKLPNGLQAVGREEVRLSELDEDGEVKQSAHSYPDAAVIEVSQPEDDREVEAGGVLTAKSIKLRRILVPPIRRWIEIIDTKDRDRLITAIEVLIPGNKAAGKLNRQYKRKVSRYIDPGVNVVEIDLLRSTRERLHVPARDIPPEFRAAYYVTVSREMEPDEWEVFPMKLREPLPTIPIPLRETDQDVTLSLQPLIDRVYAEGGHYNANYAAELPRPLSPADAAWAAGLISQS